MSKVLRDLKFKCLVCGGELPTKRTNVSRHTPGYGGWRDVETTIYDTSKDGYFVKTLTPQVFLNYYSSEKEKELGEEKKYLKNRIDTGVYDREWRRVLFSEESKELDKEYEKRTGYFNDFVDLFSRDNESIFAIDSECLETVLDSSSNVVLDKYIMGLGDEGYHVKHLKLRPFLSLESLSESFEYLSGFLDIPENKKKAQLEIKHFSEY